MVTTHDAAFLSRMLDRIPGAIYVLLISPEGAQQFVYANAASSQLFEVDLEAWRHDASKAFESVHPDDLEEWTRRGMDSMMQLVPFRWTGRLRFADDRIKWIRVVAEPERNDDGSTGWVGTAFDVTEEVLAQHQVQQLQREQAQHQSLFKAVIDNLPVGVTVIDQAGALVVFNRTSQEMAGHHDTGENVPVQGSPEQLTRAFGLFLPDQVSPYPLDQLPHVAALRGESVEAELFVRNPGRPAGVLMHVMAQPLTLADGSTVALNLSRDITGQRALEDELRERNRQLASSEEDKSQLVERLRYAIDELSNPILQVWDDVLAMPLIGVVDSRRTADMAQRLLAEVARTQAQCVIVDLTGVEVVDTKTADNLIKLVRKIELIGARCLLTGIRPSVSETVVEIGVDFAGLSTLRNLKHGLQEALRIKRRQSRLDEGLDEEEERPRSRRHRDD
ncbi:MAG: STAS domain-containing protein [Myxococcales bacterium]|nr:MAG: STAS domain-containing protein [Myxococcales bacterium]